MLVAGSDVAELTAELTAAEVDTHKHLAEAMPFVAAAVAPESTAGSEAAVAAVHSVNLGAAAAVELGPAVEQLAAPQTARLDHTPAAVLDAAPAVAVSAPIPVEPSVEQDDLGKPLKTHQPPIKEEAAADSPLAVSPNNQNRLKLMVN